MKKSIILIGFIGVMVLLTACANNIRDDINTLDVIVPNGIPALTHLFLETETNEHVHVNVERVNGPQPLTAAFTSNSHDIIIAPLNLGANLYNKGSNYQLAAVVTWGNLQLISGEQLDGFDDLEGRTIIAFGENSVPAMVLEMLIESYELSNPPIIEYLASSAQESLVYLLQDASRIVLTAEPLTSRAYEQLDSVSKIDLGTEWVDRMDQPLFPQAGVFVHNEVSLETLHVYLSAVEDSITRVLNDPSTAAMLTQTLDYPFDYDLLVSSIPNSQMAFKRAEEEQLITFFEQLYDFNKALIGDSIPDARFYIDSP